MLSFALFVLAGYLAGSMPFGLWIVRLAKGVDIRTVGSGNIGGTNVWRTFGKTYGIPVILLDMAKGFVPTLLATLYVGHLAGALTAGAAMLGHWRPLYLRFRKGGKMVATCGGALFGLAPIVAAAGLVIWLLVFGVLRYSSVASMVGSAALPFVAWGIGEPWPVIAFAAAAAAAVAVLHRANVVRLVRGKENRVSFRRRSEVEPQAH